MYFWYKLLTYLFYPFAPFFLFLRKLKKKEHSIRYKEKLSQINTPRGEGFLIWFHVVSVGEAISILPLIENFEQDEKIKRILITSITVSSAEVLKKKFNKTMIISRSHSSKNESEKLKKKYNIKKVLFLGSSLKFCYIAEGIAQIYPRNGTTYEWDTAAGHAIINGVGGKVETNKGYELKYGKKDFKNTNFIAKIF